MRSGDIVRIDTEVITPYIGTSIGAERLGCALR